MIDAVAGGTTVASWPASPGGADGSRVTTDDDGQVYETGATSIEPPTDTATTVGQFEVTGEANTLDGGPGTATAAADGSATRAPR